MVPQLWGGNRWPWPPLEGTFSISCGTLARVHINLLPKFESPSSISFEDIEKKSKIRGSEHHWVTLEGQNGMTHPGCIHDGPTTYSSKLQLALTLDWISSRYRHVAPILEKGTMTPGHHLGKFFLYWTLARPHVNFLSKSERHSSISFEDIAKNQKLRAQNPHLVSR